MPAWWPPATSTVLPLPPEFIAPQDGAEKQDCERNAAKRWLARHGAGLAHLQPVYLGEPICLACQPIVAAIHDAGGNFILTCKSTSHQTVAEYLHGAELQEHRQAVCKRGKRTTTIYRWLNAVPLRGTDDAILVNWFSIEILNAKGKAKNLLQQLRHRSRGHPRQRRRTGRLRSRRGGRSRTRPSTCSRPTDTISSTILATAREHLASVLVTLNLLAFAFHTAAYLGVLAWRTAVIARGPTYRFFEHLRTITVYVVFEDWSHLLQSIAAAAMRPP